VSLPARGGDQRPILGIDLGTSHCVAAFYDGGALPGRAAELEPGAGDITVLPLQQPVDAHTLGPRELLPSVLFAPLGDEANAVRHPRDDRFVFGEWARRRGAEAPIRLVSSAKSWLSHGAVDRDAPLLPWGASESDATIARISPIDASARYLSVISDNYTRATGRSLDETEIILTIPASFDDTARELTLLAAKRAGLSVHLVEEPTAAFHDWLARHGTAGLAALLEAAGTDTMDVVVVDVGGGTTDLSLLRLAQSAPGSVPTVARVAVSDHLLLGGDNMDLALAVHLEPTFSGLRNVRLEPARFAELTLAARRAKEALLSSDDAPPETTAPVTLLGRGSKLLGGAQSAPLSLAEVSRLLIDGFFPLVEPAAPGLRPPPPKTGALRASGLPYARDPAISKHLAAFLERPDVAATTSARPLAVLPNGGVFRSPLLVRRLAEVVETLTGRRPTMLVDRDTDLAVARGAVAFARSRRGEGTRIRSGTPRTYFVAVAAADGSPSSLLSILPRGSEPSVRHFVDLPLKLVTGRRVRFDLYTSTDSSPVPTGTLTPLDPSRHERLPPVTAVLTGDAHETLPVGLEAELTEVGTLALTCVERDAPTPRRFRLEFHLRGEPSPSMLPPPPPRLSTLPPPSTGARSLHEVEASLRRVFVEAGSDPRAAKDLPKLVEKQLGERASWDARLCRDLADRLLSLSDGRRRSEAHERAFFALSGFTLRPGLGYDGDEARVAALFAAAESSLATPVSGRDAKGYQQIFVALRRIAAGLAEGPQQSLFGYLWPFCDGKVRKKGPPNGADDELISLAVWLHRVRKRDRAELGDLLVERTYGAPSPRLWELVGRVGARRLPYGSAHLALEAKVVEPWAEDLLREKWDRLATARRALRELARFTGDRQLDLSPSVRTRIVKRLVAEGESAAAVAAIERLVEEDTSEEGERWGEALPPGLFLPDT
jgi:molecular chaperone DnaK (HSP70)